MSKITPLPWQFGKVFNDTPAGYPKRNIYGFDEQHICRIVADDTRAENAEFIVECVNNYQHLRALNAELLAFVREYVDRFGARHSDETDSPMVTKARELLKAVAK